MEQNPNAKLAKNVHIQRRGTRLVYFAWIMICVLVYAPSHEMRYESATSCEFAGRRGQRAHTSAGGLRTSGAQRGSSLRSAARAGESMLRGGGRGAQHARAVTRLAGWTRRRGDSRGGERKEEGKMRTTQVVAVRGEGPVRNTGGRAN